MDWMEGIGEAIAYIEAHITQTLPMKDIAKRACVSAFYFQRGFAMLCGFTVGDYIRQRRLTLAGAELAATGEKIIDIALKYGYDSPEGFTKAFTRFHGVTPIAVRKEGASLKSFAPLKIIFSLEGGYMMDYKIVEKDAFTVVGVSRVLGYEDAAREIPDFWRQHHHGDSAKMIRGMYGVCMDENKNAGGFEYMIADNYDPTGEWPRELVTRSIPRHTWAVFFCTGPLPGALQDVNRKIFSEWLPNCKSYKIAANYNLEFYTDPRSYALGDQDKAYQSQIWIPVTRV